MTDALARYRSGPEPGAVADARRTVADGLAKAGLRHLADDAVLVATELVTNAILHAGTELEVVVCRKGAGARIEVHDRSDLPVSLPSRAPVDADDPLAAEPMTGRGLFMVAAVADAWGVETHDDGKTVWAEVGTGSVDSPGWRPPELAPPPAPDVPLQPVRFVGIPVRLATASDTHLDDLVREFQVLMVAHGASSLPVPRPLVSLVTEILERYAEPRLAGREVARQAMSRGDRLIDVSVGVPAQAVSDMWHLSTMLEQVDEYSREGTLLTLPPSTEVRAFRRWWVSEMERQVRGAPPRPCPFPVVPPDDPAVLMASMAADMLLAERSARVAAEESAGRLAGLQAVTAGLAGAVTSAQVADVVLGQGVPALGGLRGSVCLLQADGESVDIVHQVGYPEEITHPRAPLRCLRRPARQ